MNSDIVPLYVEQFLERLENVRPTRNGWDACCPCPEHNHDGDQNPSLRITLGDDDRILVKCRVGCQTDAVLDALNLDWVDLFPPQDEEEICLEGLNPSATAPTRRPKPTEEADLALYDRAYQLLLSQLPLDEDHHGNLRRRGLADSEIDRRGYGSLRNTVRGLAARAVHQQLGDAVFGVPGFVQGAFGVTLDGEATGLLIPVRDLHGRVVALKIRRATEPRYVYLTSSGSGPSPGSPVHVPLGIPMTASTVRITEGELKADVAFVLDGTPTIVVPGVTQWRPALPLLETLGARTAVLSFDAMDVLNKVSVFQQTEAFFSELEQLGFNVQMEVWQ